MDKLKSDELFILNICKDFFFLRFFAIERFELPFPAGFFCAVAISIFKKKKV